MILLWTVVICVVLAGALVGVLAWLNLLPGWDRDRADPDKQVSPGCLMSLIAASAVWFVAWTIVLVMAISFLRTPLD